MNIKHKLLHAVTQYDRKQSTKANYNHHALGIYMQRVDDVVADILSGATVRQAIIAGFSGPLCNAVLKAVGEPKVTQDETDRSSWVYRPVAKISR